MYFFFFLTKLYLERLLSFILAHPHHVSQTVCSLLSCTSTWPAGVFGLISLLLCFRLIHCTWVYPVEQYPAFFGYYFFNIMLLVLQFLHIFWAYLILCMVRKFMSGNVSWWSFKTAQSWYHILVTLSRNWSKRGNREYPLCFLTLRLWHWESTNQMTTGS